MKRNTNLLIIGGIIILLIIIVQSGLFNLQSGAISGTNVVKYAIPHMASFKCDVIGSSSPTYQIPTAGIWISKDSVGAVTDKVTDIKVMVTQSFWDKLALTFLGGGTWIEYKTCNGQQANCVSHTQNLQSGLNVLQGLPSAIQVNDASIYIQVKGRGTIFSSDQPISDPGMTLSYSFDKFGLVLYSTTKDPAGYKVCTSSCDLSCPSQGDRAKLVYTTKNSLDPVTRETAPYLEYWETIDYDLNSQGGATIYNSASNTFCFAGDVYNAGQITTETGTTYVYPDTATRQNHVCCPGAVISTLQENKICNDNYEWETITKDTQIKCISDINCPGAGQNTCQNKMRSGYSCGSAQSDGNRYCSQDLISVPVECCSANDCATDQACDKYKCVGGSVNVPIAVNNTPSNPADCALKGGTWHTKSTIVKEGMFCFNGIGICSDKVVIDEYCDTNQPNYLLLILVAIGIGIIFYVIGGKKRR